MIEDLRLSFGKILDFLQLTTCSLLFFGIVKLFSSVGKIAWLKLISQQQARNMNGPQGLQVDSPDLLDILILNMKYVTLFWNHAKYRDISHLSATSDFILEHLAWYLCWSSRYRSSTVLMAAHTKCHYTRRVAVLGSTSHLQEASASCQGEGHVQYSELL